MYSEELHIYKKRATYHIYRLILYTSTEGNKVLVL